MDITTLLNNINLLYLRKQNINELISWIQKKDIKIFSDNGLVIINLKELLKTKNVNMETIKKHLPIVVHGGVDGADVGAIQDPAGSAIGSGNKPDGGGASDAIYKKFLDLEPIPQINKGDAVFNGSTGLGKKILHSYAYSLTENPSNENDRYTVINKLKKTYVNAIKVFGQGKSKLDKKDQHRLNLVPVSAAIFGGQFKDASIGHLQPSYTFAAIVLAIDECIKGHVDIPELYIYYYGEDVKKIADKVRNELMKID